MSAVNSILNLLRFNRKNWKAVVLCLVAATVFWFFNALNKTYTTILSFPVEFQYDQDNFVPVSDLPGEVKMNVTGLGWTLIRRSAGVKVPSLIIPLEHPTEVKKVVGSTLPVLIANQVTDLQINFVATDTLRLDIEPIAGRWLTLTLADMSDRLRQGYGIASSATLTPDSVFVQGPRRLVEGLHEPYEIAPSGNGISDNVETEMAVPFEYDRFGVEPHQINVSFSVEKMTEVKDSVRVLVINVPSRKRPAINLQLIRFRLQIPSSLRADLYNRDAIYAVVDLKQTGTGRTRIVPALRGLPPFSKLMEVDTVEVVY